MTLSDPSVYGLDVTTWANPGQTYPDLDPTFTLLAETNPRVVAEAVARSLCTERGSLEEEPDRGIDLRKWVNGKWTQQRLFRAQQAIVREALKDERVYGCRAALRFANRRLAIEIDVELMEGTFRLVLAITHVSVEVLTEL